MVTSIGYSLGAGAGIDTKALIEQLAKADKEPKEALITRREEANSAKISALATASNAIDSFATALSKLIAGGSLFTQPSVSDTSVLTASTIAGADIGELSAQIEVRQLAQSQSLVSANLASSSATVGQGTLTLTVASGSYDITIDATNDSLGGLAKAINDKNVGVTATIVTDSNGSRLVLKGATGTTNAFSLLVPGGTTSGLERFAYDPNGTSGMTAAQVARNAIVRLDGVDVERGSNSFSDLISGVQIDLKKAVPGTAVSLGMTRPTETIKQAINDFAEAFNELHSLLAEATAYATDKAEAGPLRGDTGIRQMQRQLARLTTSELTSSGQFKTLAEIGVATNRDGTLRVDTTKLNSALTSDPKAVEALFNPRQYSSDPGVTIMSKAGATKPGTYTLTNIQVGANGSIASGFIDGAAMIGTETTLRAPVASPAYGLMVRVDASVATATITVEAGLGGALQMIRDELRASNGPLATTQERLTREAKAISADRESLERRSDAYYERLVKSFSAMDRQVNAFKATQSYLEQQMKVWSNSND